MWRSIRGERAAMRSSAPRPRRRSPPTPPPCLPRSVRASRGWVCSAMSASRTGYRHPRPGCSPCPRGSGDRCRRVGRRVGTATCSSLWVPTRCGCGPPVTDGGPWGLRPVTLAVSMAAAEALMGRLTHRAVQAVQLRDAPVRRRSPHLLSPPRPDNARTAEMGRADGGTDLVAYHLHGITDGETHFDDRETTIAHVLADPHPALAGERFGERLQAVLGARGADGPVVEIGGGTGTGRRGLPVSGPGPALAAGRPVARAAPDPGPAGRSPWCRGRRAAPAAARRVGGHADRQRGHRRSAGGAAHRHGPGSAGPGVPRSLRAAGARGSLQPRRLGAGGGGSAGAGARGSALPVGVRGARRGADRGGPARSSGGRHRLRAAGEGRCGLWAATGAGPHGRLPRRRSARRPALPSRLGGAPRPLCCAGCAPAEPRLDARDPRGGAALAGAGPRLDPHRRRGARPR